MSRRRLVAIASASVLLLLGFLVVTAVLSLTQTQFGRERIRRLVAARIAAALRGHGSMYLGRLDGNLFTGLEIDSVAIRDAEDSLLVATGPLRVRYDLRDLLDKRLLLSYVEVTRPVVNLRRHADREWNFQRIFRSSSRRQPRGAERRLGDFIVIDSVVIHDGTVVLTEPWSPPDSLTGARRDSAVRAALASTEHEIRRTSEGLKQTRRWTALELHSPYVRLADPDSAGRLIAIGRMDVVESDPPFRIRNARGPVRILGDSVWFDLAHFELPGSVGSGRGKVWWGSDLPTRYDVHIRSDSVSLADVHWVYPTLPRAGGGSLELTIRNDPRDLHVLEYALTKMDVRAANSRLLGAMTFGVGGPVLVVKDVALQADPVDFDLLRTLNGGPFPVDWQGRFIGHVRGPGGPVNRWRVDDARLTFRDKHVPGAVTTFSARGELDILEPARAKFRGLDVTIATLDLRTIRYLFPDFPRLNGTIAGTATLDSSWMDVRFRDADVFHRDGADLPSHVTGSGRVTYGEEFLAFDVDLIASPLSFTTLARSYPGLALRGPYTGPLRVQGTMSDLGIATTLTGPAGGFTVDGRFDLAAPGYAARARGRVDSLDLRTLLARPDLPTTRLTGWATGDVRGDSLATLDGAMSVVLDRSQVDTVTLFPSSAAFTFGAGRLRVDSLRLETSAGRAEARGALGLAPGVSDTLRYEVVIDSLGGLRPYMRGSPVARRAASLAQTDGGADGAAPEGPAGARPDSLGGALRSAGILVGSLDTLAVRGSVVGQQLLVGGTLAQRLDGTYAFQGLPGAPTGTARAALDSVRFAGVRLDSVVAALVLHDRSSGTLALSAASGDPHGRFVGGAALDVRRAGDTLHVAVDSAGVRAGEHAWSLTAPAHFVFDSTGTTLDSLVLRSSTGGMVALRGAFPLRGAVDGTLVADSLSLADVGALVQTSSPLDGTASLALRVTGPRDAPTLRFTSRFADMRYGDLHFPVFTVRGDYAERRLEAALDVYRDGRPVLSATSTIPVNLALATVPERILDDPLRGRISADSVNLAILEAMSSQFRRVSGSASTEIALGGTMRRPTLTGRFRIHDGEMTLPRLGIEVRALDADIAFDPDSIRIARLFMQSGSQPNSRLSIAGTIHVPNYREPRTMGFDLAATARSFEALDKHDQARLELSGSLQLSGTLTRPALAGDVTVERGTLFISDIYQKQVINLNDPEFYNIVDTSLVVNRGLLQSLPPTLDTALTNLRVPNLAVRIGDDVWIRSQEANIKLAGSMELSKMGNQRVEAGTLHVSRGTYRLNLGVVQRTFQVDSGLVTFYGDPHIPAELSIYASYIVRQASRESGQDVKIIAHIGGTMNAPQLELSSGERTPLSETEILSYLVFGRPSFGSTSEVANNRALLPSVAVLLPTVGAMVESALTNQIGFLDMVQVQLGSTGEPTSDNSSWATNALSGTRLGVGKQIGERTFVTANAGLCQLQASNSTDFYSTLGVTVEHRLNDGFSLQASVEPSSTALQCNRGTEIGRRPQQFGFDLFREWSF